MPLPQASLSALEGRKINCRQKLQHARLHVSPSLLHVPTCRTTNNRVLRRSKPQRLHRPLRQSASLASAMSDLNSPEKPRSEPSLAGSQPHSWSDVTLIEDVTQEFSSRHQPANCVEECSSESVAEPPSPPEPPPEPLHTQIPAHAVCVVKRFRARSRSRGLELPIASACDTIQPSHAACDTDMHRLLPLSRVPRPSLGLPGPTCSRHSRLQETDTALVGQLHPPSKGGMQPRFFAPSEVVRTSAGGGSP